MLVKSNRKEYTPRFIAVDTLEKLWKNDGDTYLINYKRKPEPQYWLDNKTGDFITGDARFDYDGKGSPRIGFTDGRNRTRWLINTGRKLIPVGLTDENYNDFRNYSMS